MGAWGYRPRDNDGAQDAFCLCLAAAERHAILAVGCAVTRDIKRRVPVASWCEHGASWAAWEKLGVIETMLGLGASMPLRVFRCAVKWLRAIAKDDAWLD